MGDAYCVSPDLSGNDSAPKYYYRYTESDSPASLKGGMTAFLLHGRMVTVGRTMMGFGLGKWLPYVPEGEQYKDDFLWTKIVHSDGSVDIIPPPKSGEPAYGIDIIAEPTSFQLTSRGVVKDNPAVINLSILRHYVVAPAVWSLVSGEYKGVELHPDETNTDIATLTIQNGADIRSVAVKVEIGEKGVSSQVIIQGIDGGVPVSHYFGIYPLDEADARPVYNKDTHLLDIEHVDFPEIVDGEGPVIKGDHILFMTDIVSGEGAEQKITTELVPFFYTGSTWEMVSEYTSNYSEIMSDILPDVVSRPDMPVTFGAIYGFFQNLAAQTAFIQRLFANYVRLEGAIYAGSYNELGENPTNGLGFWLGSSGTLKAVQAYLREAIVEGMFTCSDIKGIVLQTQKGVDTTAQIECSAPERWAVSDLLESIAEGGSGTATYSAKSYSYKRCSTSSYLQLWEHDSNEWFHSINETLTMPISGKLLLICTRFSEWNGQDFKPAIKHNGSTIWDAGYFDDFEAHEEIKIEVTVKKGDTLQFKAEQSFMGVNVSFFMRYVDTSSVLLYDSSDLFNSLIQFTDGEIYSKALIAGSFNSESHLKYAIANGWADGLVSFNEGYTMAPGTFCTINGELLEIASVLKTSSSLLIYTASGGSYNLLLSHTEVEGDTDGWYWISGKLSIIAEQRGVVVETLIPAKDTADCGTPANPFENGYFKKASVAGIILNDRELEIGEDGIVRAKQEAE